MNGLIATGSVQHFVFIECALILILFGIIFTFHLYQTAREKEGVLKQKKLKQFFLHALLTNDRKSIPKASLKPLIAALSEVNDCFNDVLWITIKKETLEPWAKKLTRYARSKKQEKRALALRAFILSPELFKEELFQKSLSNIPPLLIGECVQVFCQNPKTKIVELLLDHMIHGTVYMRHLIRDETLRSGLPIYMKFLEVFRNESSIDRKIACLEILSQKTGYLTLDDIRPCVSSRDIRLKWWGIKALENAPSDESLSLLLDHLQCEYIDVRCVVASALGAYRYENVLQSLEILLNDEHWLVRMYAGLSIQKLGKQGIERLDQIQSSCSEQTKTTISYIRSVKQNMNPSFMIKWLEGRAMR